MLGACALLVGLLLAPPASSAATSPYGHFRISYRDRTTYTWQVREAIASWNRAGTPFRLVPARPAARADITITQKPYIGSPSSSVAGYGGIGFVQLSAARLKSPKAFHNGQVRIVAHELGHALGLGHLPNRCAIMYSPVDHPASRRCAIVERQWDGRQHCGPRAPDILALARRWRFRPRPVPWRGYCTTPTNPATAATGPHVGGLLSGELVQHPYDGEGSGMVQLTLSNTGNTQHEVGSYGVVLVDAAGAVLPSPWRFDTWYHAIARPPGPGQSIAVPLPLCSGDLPLTMRIRLASQHHDAFLGPELQVRVDVADGDPAAPANECIGSASSLASRGAKP